MPRKTTLRERVLAVIKSSKTSLTGAEVAQRAGITYQQAVFAINGLYNLGRIERIGRKATAKWVIAIPPEPNIIDQYMHMTGIKR